eukprot:14920105-Heterocapsa_arctica.AAC.1
MSRAGQGVWSSLLGRVDFMKVAKRIAWSGRSLQSPKAQRNGPQSSNSSWIIGGFLPRMISSSTR